MKGKGNLSFRYLKGVLIKDSLSTTMQCARLFMF